MVTMPIATEDRVCALVYKCLNGCGPAYLADKSSTSEDVQSRRRLRSSSSSMLIVPVTRRATLDDRAFPVVAARAWNGLPDCVSQRQPTHHSVLRWRRICFPGLSDRPTDNMHHTDFVVCNVVLTPEALLCLHHVNPVVWCGWWWWWCGLSSSSMMSINGHHATTTFREWQCPMHVWICSSKGLRVWYGLYNIQGGPKKWTPNALHITSSNIGRF